MAKIVDTFTVELKIKPKDLKRLTKNANKLAKEVVNTTVSLNAMFCALEKLGEATKEFRDCGVSDDDL